MSFAARLKLIVLSPAVPVWLVIFLLPFGRSSVLGTLLCVIGAIIWLVRERRAVASHAGVRMLLWLCAAYVGAALVSAPDALEAGRSWESVAGYLRFAPFGVYFFFALRDRGRLHALFDAVAVVVALWTLDAWVQAFTGWSVGGHAQAVRVTGIFGADNMKLGPVLAALAPFVLWSAQERWRWRGLIGAFVFLLGPILLAGSRAAWISYAVVGVAFAWRACRTPARFAVCCAGAGAVVVVAAALAWQFSPRFHARAERSLEAFSGSEAGLNDALSGRLDIWHTAWDMYLAHPVNGVGVRDFRYAYPDFAPRRDHFVAIESCGAGQGACHPHQLVLEIATNTGTLGLLLWVAGGVFAWRRWRGAGMLARNAAFPASVALAATVFPINSHLAFYSAWWGLLFWWLLALWCAALHACAHDADGHVAVAAPIAPVQ